MAHRRIPAALAAITAALVAIVPATVSSAAPMSHAALRPVTPSSTDESGTAASPAAAATSTGDAAATSTAAPATSTGGAAATAPDTVLTITAVLRPGDRSALRALVRHTGALSAADRAARVGAVAPATSGRGTVRTALTAAGFTVTGAHRWDVEATGTAADAEALFGVHLVGSGDAIHPTSAPTMPAAFGDAVSTVLGLDTRPVVSPSAIPGGLTPADLASAYSASASSTAGAGGTIATIQFSGWNSSDLTTYASAAGRAMPSVTQIGVDGASPTAISGTGDLEVALDQEMLLAGAPAAAQRIYFAPAMSASGMYDVYAQIANDVASQRITAVSTSWASCETSMSANLRAVLEDAIDRIVANGATMFAASGDTGASCDTGSGATTSVEYPASSPAVIGVGGTSLTRSGSSWSETTWNSSGQSSGGGASTVTGRPSWQSGVGIAGSTRLVPDIAGTADPHHGPGVYVQSQGGWVLGGGTSLASPLMAAQLTASLTARGCGLGVGDVHGVLYAHPADFRDVTTGDNGTASARTGYDEVTGLGSPIWSSLVQDLPTPSGCTSGSTPAPTASPTATAAAVPTTPGVSADGTTATATTTLTAGQGIHSPSRRYRVTVTSDGNLVETGNGRVLWSAIGTTNAGGSLTLRADGNAVLTSTGGSTVWATGTTGSNVVLSLSDTGLLALAQGSTVLWTNGRPGADTLSAGASLGVGDSLWDSGLRREVTLTASGNLVLAIDGRTVWASGTSGRGARRAVLRPDGALVLVSAGGRVVWTSGTTGSGSGVQLTMRSDGDLVLTRAGSVIWSTGTAG